MFNAFVVNTVAKLNTLKQACCLFNDIVNCYGHCTSVGNVSTKWKQAASVVSIKCVGALSK
jgi:hypothetical protein